MAEIVAGAVAVEEVVSYTAYLGVGAYMVSRPTMPLKATFSQIATSSDDSTRMSLTRTGHSLTIVDNKAYIFGGTTATEKLSSNDLHAITLTTGDHAEPQYSVIPGIAQSEGGAAPAARTKHAACAVSDHIAILGGADEDGNLVDEKPCLWLFDTKTSTWESHAPANPAEEAPPPRTQGKLFAHRDTLVLYGGFDGAGAPLQDTWTYAMATKFWTAGPVAPVHTASAALCDAVLYLVSSPSPLSSDLHFLPVVPPLETPHQWSTVPFPTNPLTPGPAPRTGAELLPLRTGHGRLYLLYLFGAAPAAGDADSPPAAAAATPYHSDLWTYQLPSAHPEVPGSAASLTSMSTLSAAVQPARIKDAIRGALGLESGSHSWAEVEVLAPSETDLNFAHEGKVHPGPRGFAAADVMQDGKGVVLWGGVNAKGEREGDGWMIRLE
nr:uncharacterized protein LOC112020305 [Quercus suber]POF15610.1 tip elongation aberrant protein 3 [Quercus suber]